jgi:hypothetical protein
VPRPLLPQNLRGFEQVRLAVIEQDVGLPVLGERGVRAALADVPFEWAFAWAARIDAVIRNGQHRGRARDTQVQAVAEVFEGHPKQEQLIRLVATEGRELFNTPNTHAIERLLVQEALDGAVERSGDRERMQAAFLGISNVLSPASARPTRFDLAHHLALMMRASVGNATEPPVESISRAYAVYYELPRRQDAAEMPNYLPRDQWEPDQATTLSVHERFLVGMAVMGKVGVNNEVLPATPTGVPDDYFEALAKELPDGDVDRLACAIAADRGWFQRTFDRERPALRETASNSIPFQVRPLLQQSVGGYLLSSSDALASWMTRGVHYACLAPIEGTPAGHAFLTYVGRLLETYAYELIADVHRGQAGVLVLGEQPYDGGSSRTSDIVVADGVDLVLIEVEARRFSRQALLSADPQDVLDEVEKMVVSKARQIGECITALRREESPAQLPGVDIQNVERIWPVVLTEGGIAHTPVLRDHLAKALAGALDQPGVERLSIMSMTDFELACGFIEHDHRLAMTLKRWQHGQRRDTDFRNFCSTKQDLKQPRRASLIDRRWERLASEVRAAFSPEAQARLRGDRT